MNTKQCRVCKQELPVDQFHRNSSRKDGLRAECKTCAREYLKGYYQTDKGRAARERAEHSERRKEQLREYHSRPEVKQRSREQRRSEKAKATNRRHYQERRDHYIERHRAYRQTEKSKEQKRRYLATERGKAGQAKQNQDRRAARIQAKLSPNPLAIPQWEQTKAHFEGRCAYCRKMTERPTRDHLIPLSKGGTYTMGNIIPACRSCNSRKHTKDAREWMEANGMDWDALIIKLAELEA